MKWWTISLTALAVGFLGWQFWYVFLIGIKQPAYTVVEKRKGYEIRKYEEYLTAHTFVSGTYKEAEKKGFKVLAKYIFGENSENKSMPMTAPVFMKKHDKGYKVSFVMPFKYDLKTLPKPLDKKIVIKKVPQKTVAAYRFTWYPTEVRVEQKEKNLKELLKKDGVKLRSSIRLARYNPPFVLPFLLCNELLVEVGTR